MMVKRAFLAAIATIFGLMISATPTLAGSTPFDSSTAIGSGARTAVNSLVTAPFALGEVDLTTLGVPLTELSGAGLVGATDPPPPDSDNMLIVSNNGSCPNAEYPSIQSAVTAASPGARIKVCPGTYVEQVYIPPGKDDLYLFSEVPLEAIIQAPVTMTNPPTSNSIVTIESQNVTLRQFTVTGPFVYAGCAPPEETHT